MKKYLLFISLLLIVGCSNDKRTLSYFNLPFGKTPQEVTEILSKSGCTLFHASPDRKGLVFENGKFLNYDVESLFIDFDDSYCMTSMKMLINNEASMFYEVTMNILGKDGRYGTPTIDLDSVNHKINSWVVGGQKITLALKDKTAIYLVRPKDSSW